MNYRPLIAIAALYAAAPLAAEVDGAALMAEANALTRSKVYRTALLRYREAAAAGLDTPLLHYNLGIVYYRLDRYADAVHEFERAATDARLAALARYNAGLAQRAAGDRPSAERSFLAAAALAHDRELRRLAQRAAEASAASAAVQAARSDRPRTAVARAEDSGDRLGELRFEASASIGQDDNVYRAPADPYVDLSDPARPVVTPVVRSATFTPVDLRAAYVLHNEAGDTDFMFAYMLDGDFFASEFTNANRVSQRFSIGADIVLGERERRRRTLQTAFFVRDHVETNFDPDTGLDREIEAVDISRRFDYQSSGVEGEFEHAVGAWRWGFEMRFERREYQTVPLVPNYDHEYYFTAATIERALDGGMTVTGGLRRYRRLYDSRPARDLNGDLLIANPAEEYDYRGVDLGFEKRFTRTIALDFDYLWLERIDEFVGYYDYTENAARIRAVFRPGARLDVSLGALVRNYDYPNAFAFNEPSAGAREHEEIGAQLAAEFRISSAWSLEARLDTTDVTSTDARAEYARTRATFGATWRR